MYIHTHVVLNTQVRGISFNYCRRYELLYPSLLYGRSLLTVEYKTSKTLAVMGDPFPFVQLS
jgi:hypothetical protein